MQTNSQQILNVLDALAVATFIDIGEQIDRHGDINRAEVYYQRAVRAAETIYGAEHGEVGLVLMRLADFYRRHGKWHAEDQVLSRVEKIVALYKCDQEH